VGPVQGPSVNAVDLLAVWRTTGGITFNLPDIVIWRVILKISVTWKFSVASEASNTGVFTTVYVDSVNQAVLEPLTHPYDQQYLMWTWMPIAEEVAQGPLLAIDTTSQHMMYKTLDIKSHRKLKNELDTLYLTLTGTGNMNITDYTIQQSTLLRFS
jgi:hypothetical protein